MTASPPTFWRRNGLSLVLIALFLSSLIAQSVFGYFDWNEALRRAGAPSVSPVDYLCSGHFISATFENWESEFLQMGMYVLLTVWLRQRGSAESRPLTDEPEKIQAGPTPWPVRRGGWWARLYANSLSITFLLLFLASFVLHLYGSWRHELAELTLQGQPAIGLAEHALSATFWFESFQNWQSEFLAVLSIVVLSIYLRQDKSPESKPVAAPHQQTGA